VLAGRGQCQPSDENAGTAKRRLIKLFQQLDRNSSRFRLGPEAVPESPCLPAAQVLLMDPRVDLRGGEVSVPKQVADVSQAHAGHAQVRAE